MLVDTHCHLDFSDFSDDRDQVVANARTAGVGKMLTISTRVKRFAEVREIAEQYDGVYCSVGTHCCYSDEETDVTAEDLISLSAHPKCVAIGESGLDYVKGGAKEIQMSSFLRHIAASQMTGLPLIVHARNADEDLINVLNTSTKQKAFPHVLHCFSSGNELAWSSIELGGYISFSGIIAFTRGAEDLKELARQVPADRLLVETDAPYLSPPPHRGKRNEPAFVVETAAVLAQLRGVDYSSIECQTTENFYRLFNKVVQ